MNPPHRARKRFGQHFLRDERVLDRLASAIAPRPEDQLVEIGPGRGALTRYLYDQVGTFVAVELDRDLVPLLERRFPGIEVVSADILRIDLDSLLEPPPWRLVGNLPYNISSPLLLKLFAHLNRIRDMHFMFQRELGQRLTASPGGGNWGRLSVVAQYHCHVESLFDVPPDAFSPPPKVYSQLLRLTPRTEREPVNPKAFDRVLRLAFSARRKRVGKGLKSLSLDWAAIGVDPDLRPDALSVEAFVRIANALEEAGVR